MFSDQYLDKEENGKIMVSYFLFVFCLFGVFIYCLSGFSFLSGYPQHLQSSPSSLAPF